MKNVFLILATSIFLSSCATIMNQSHKKITIHTTQPSKIVVNQDTLHTNNNQATLEVKRKKEPIKITTSTDSLTKTITLNPQNSFFYLSNIFQNLGIGMLVDKHNPKRYTYPRHIYLNSTDTISSYYIYDQGNKKGSFDWQLSLPYINSFLLVPEAEATKINTGFWGLSIGLAYYHSEKQFINFGISGAADFFLPVPAAIDLSGEYELMTSAYASISNNHELDRFSIGYGLAFAKNTWDFRYYDRFDPPPPSREPVKKSSSAFGLIFPSYVQLGNRFNIGLIYRPTFYRPKLIDKFSYEHLVTIDLAWKFSL